jgi:hypothetical protein
MKLNIAAAALVAVALPAAPALAHCRTTHHRVAYHAPVRHHVVRTACACGTRVAHRARAYREAYVRPAAYPIVYRPRVVEVTYERPLYRAYRPIHGRHFYRPRPLFYGARDERFPHRFHRWDGDRRDRFARYDGFRRDRFVRGDGFRRDRFARDDGFRRDRFSR